MTSKTIKITEENEMEKRRINITGLKKEDSVREISKGPKRPALGELGNRPVSRNVIKDTNLAKAVDYKHIKPRVDCWKGKEEKDVKPEVIQVLRKIERTRRVKQAPIEQPKPKVATEIPKILLTRPSNESNHSRANAVQPVVKPTKTLATPPQVRSHSQKLLCQIEDIDEEGSNIFLVSDYANDVYNYLFELENENPIAEKFLDNHDEISSVMRTILMDWLNETHAQFQLVMETYFLTVSLVDSYLQKHPETKRKHLQLVGCTAMFIAAKYEEVYAPDIKEFVYITDRSYTEKQICHMEKSILVSVNFQLGQPLPIQFLRRFSKAANADAIQHLMGKYFIELISIEYSMAHIKKSLMSAASLYLATHIYNNETSFNPSLWTSTLEYYSTYTAADLKPVALQIIKLVKNAPKGPKNKYYAIFTKYSSSKFEAISKKLIDTKTRVLLDSLQDSNC